VVGVPSDVRRRAVRVVPLGLALALIAIVVLAGVLPGTGVVSASSSCTYGACPASSPFPYWAIGAAAAVVVVALVAALLLLRRRKPPAGSDAPPQEGTSPDAEGTGPQTWNEPPASETPSEAPDGYGPADDASGGGSSS
jgi:uncharacterized protein (TIGR03382 family)